MALLWLSLCVFFVVSCFVVSCFVVVFLLCVLYFAVCFWCCFVVVGWLVAVWLLGVVVCVFLLLVFSRVCVMCMAVVVIMGSSVSMVDLCFWYMVMACVSMSSCGSMLWFMSFLVLVANTQFSKKFFYMQWHYAGNSVN